MTEAEAAIGRAAREAARLTREEDLPPQIAIATACATEGVDDYGAVVDLLKAWSELTKRLNSL